MKNKRRLIFRNDSRNALAIPQVASRQMYFGKLFKDSEGSVRYPPTTSQPLASRNLTRWEPINPSAPVTSAVFFIGLVESPSSLKNGKKQL